MKSNFFYWVLRGLQDFFTVDTRQAKGLLLMMLLILCLVFGPFIFRIFLHRSASQRVSVHHEKLDQLILQLEQARASQGTLNAISSNMTEPSPVDPNVGNQEALEAVGFPRWMAQRIINYRQAGGVYTNKDDMMRLYGMTDEMYEKVQVWLRFPSKPSPKITKPLPTNNPVKSGGWDALAAGSNAPSETTKTEVLPFEINITDTLQLQEIPGIGPVLASRIVRYRDLLGGFYSKEQLREVYGLPEETVERLLEKAVVDSLQVEKTIRINQAEDPAELARHPYLSFREARAIINYRKQHGPYTRWEDLQNLYALADSTLLKIKPYIKLDDENP